MQTIQEQSVKTVIIGFELIGVIISALPDLSIQVDESFWQVLNRMPAEG